MRWSFFFFLSVFLPVLCRAQVLLNEVYYDHPGTDEGYEFIELVNVAETPVALAGCTVEFHDGASSGWAKIWQGGVLDSIGGSGLFVLGGARVVPPPDATVELGLQNGPDAVRLVFNGRVADLLGYGSLDDPESFEGTSAPDVPSGSSLARCPDGVDTDDNNNDFVPKTPSPGRRNVPRRDIALRASADSPRRDARAEPGVEVLAFDVMNRGVEPVGSEEITFVVADSTDRGTRGVWSAGVSHAIRPGDSTRVEAAVDLSRGFHWIRATVDYAEDERPEDNTVNLLRRVGGSPVVLSEVMSCPRAGCPEYVELFNSGAVPYELSRHWIRDAAHAPALIVSRNLEIPPGGFLVLTEDAAGLGSCFPGAPLDAVLEIEGAWPTLNHTGSGEADSVIVLDMLLVPVERVAYPPQPGESSGRSLERVDLYTGPGPHAWVLSGAALGGSPGEKPPHARLSPLEGARVAVSPNPFDPHRESIVVTAPRRDDPERLVASVYDIDGNRVAELGTTTMYPWIFVWDGRDAGGRIVPSGIYILACEFFSVSAGSRRVERVVVGCGRKSYSGANR